MTALHSMRRSYSPCRQVIKGCGVIQSDGIDIAIMRKMCGSLEAAGFSAENITYGMGGGLLQKVGGRLREEAAINHEGGFPHSLKCFS